MKVREYIQISVLDGQIGLNILRTNLSKEPERVGSEVAVQQ